MEVGGDGLQSPPLLAQVRWNIQVKSLPRSEHGVSSKPSLLFYVHCGREDECSWDASTPYNGSIVGHPNAPYCLTLRRFDTWILHYPGRPSTGPLPYKGSGDQMEHFWNSHVAVRQAVSSTPKRNGVNRGGPLNTTHTILPTNWPHSHTAWVENENMLQNETRTALH